MIRHWPLVGRSEELALIDGAVHTPGDRPRGIVVSGPAGVGKTRVAREAMARTTRRDTHRYWIGGTASARHVPLGAFADIASDFGPDPLRRVREVIDALTGARRGDEIIVGVDDAHLLDDLSAFTVHQLVTRRLATVILTIRSGEPAPDAVTAIWKDHHLPRLELQPLSLAETTRLAEEVLTGPVHSRSARGLWQYTQGNVLYLRHLLDSEIESGRMARHGNVWLWDGQPALSPTLAELVDARISRAPGPVRDVLDVLALAEPLDIDVVTALVGADSLADAETLDLVRIDTTASPPAVRLAHPMFGEVRRTASLRMRRWAGRIAAALPPRRETDPRRVLRRALLLLESDLEPGTDLLVSAASAASALLDARLAAQLAEQAVHFGGGHDARFALALANFWLERPVQAETILAELADQTTGPTRERIATLRISILAGELGQVADAEREYRTVFGASDARTHSVSRSLRALIDVVRGRSALAVPSAMDVIADRPDDDFAYLHAIFVAVSGLGDLGRIGEIEAAAERGHELTDRSPGVSHARYQLAFLHANAYRLAGALTRSDAVIARIRRETRDVPFEDSWHCLFAGMSAMSRGDLPGAQRSLQEALAVLGSGDTGRVIKSFGRCWLATVTAMAGRAAEARREFDAIEWWAQQPQACVWDAERSIAEAWVCAAEGAISQAISILRAAADRERDRGRPAWEAMLLQAATQFGDTTTAARLAEIATGVEGPRAAVAAAHAAALATGDGDGLIGASQRYDEFGDHLAAADAAAQAVVAYQRAGLRGSALTASATARRLSTRCASADTPAQRCEAMRLPITPRQREIITLAARGLSNKEIADRLTMSVRSIEGHLFRASQRVGANGRDQLIAMLADG
ncbi:AAA family ATPase [Mycolicibacterium sp.]|uniref:AAA family ATPase n=1 Tax=Mycolicibacterium sp. TaxID=2320850 RepID=UPI003D0B784F